MRNLTGASQERIEFLCVEAVYLSVPISCGTLLYILIKMLCHSGILVSNCGSERSFVDLSDLQMVCC